MILFVFLMGLLAKLNWPMIYKLFFVYLLCTVRLQNSAQLSIVSCKARKNCIFD